MRAYHYTLPKHLDSVLKDGIGFRPLKDWLSLSLDSDLSPQMMTILDVNQVVVFEVEIPDRTWMQTTKDSVILYQTVQPDWIKNWTLVSE